MPHHHERTAPLPTRYIPKIPSPPYSFQTPFNLLQISRELYQISPIVSDVTFF